MINLSEFLKDVDSQKYPKIGQIIRQDFIDFSSTLEKYAFNYFQKELLQRKMNDLSKWHKYPLEVTRERLAKTDLFTKREEILSLIEA